LRAYGYVGGKKRYLPTIAVADKNFERQPGRTSYSAPGSGAALCNPNQREAQ
jgi:hypothetical protein